MNKPSFKQELRICSIVIASLKTHLVELADEYPHDSQDSAPFAIRRQQVALRICEDELERLECEAADMEHSNDVQGAARLGADITALRGLLAETADVIDPIKEQVREMKWQVEVRRSACL